ncbi:MAG: hypothetical protein RIK87_15230 [Fuerstiella sp.]
MFSSDTVPCDLVVDPPLSGEENMRRDEFLLQTVAAKADRSFVRIYRWNEPTVSVGYFQKSLDDVDPRLAHCPRVRRASGGGAILHDDEWTYSCALPNSHPLRSDPVSLYSVIHTAIVQLMTSCGAAANLRMDAAQATAAPSEEPFLCFLRADPRDVVYNGHKILGSAQRRRRGNIMQHGSILMRASTLLPAIPGIVDLCPDFRIQKFETELPGVIAHSIAEDVRINCGLPSESTTDRT